MVVSPVYFITDWSKKDDVKFGNDPGSPKNTMLKKKFIYTSIITLFLTIIILLIKNEIF